MKVILGFIGYIKAIFRASCEALVHVRALRDLSVQLLCDHLVEPLPVGVVDEPVAEDPAALVEHQVQ